MKIAKIVLTTIIIWGTAMAIDVKLLPFVYGYLARVGIS
jgi:hypothetical protein